MPLYHMDVYRIGGDEDLGFDEYIEGQGVTVIEWATIIEDQLPDTFLKIIIRLEDNETREIKLEPIGERYEQLCKELTDHEYTGD